MYTKAHGLNMPDAMRTKALSLKCGKKILSFSPKSKREPGLPLYCAHEGGAYVPDDEVEIGQASYKAGASIGP
jgi:hypothetical protein